MNDITPKEAIANLNHLYGMVAPDIQRSLDVAIKALERPQGDCISREALKEAITLYNKNVAEETWEQLYDSVLETIDNAQAVDLWQMRQEATENAMKKAEVLYGNTDCVEWETTVHGVLAYKVCGGCKAEYLFDLTYGWKLCPKCGAKMKGGTE